MVRGKDRKQKEIGKKKGGGGNKIIGESNRFRVSILTYSYLVPAWLMEFVPCADDTALPHPPPPWEPAVARRGYSPLNTTFIYWLLSFIHSSAKLPNQTGGTRGSVYITSARIFITAMDSIVNLLCYCSLCATRHINMLHYYI